MTARPVRLGGRACFMLASSGCGGSASPIEGYDRLQAMKEELAALPAAEQLTDRQYLNGKVVVVAIREGYPGVVFAPLTPPPSRRALSALRRETAPPAART